MSAETTTELTGAALLREAARVIRERAEAAGPTPWTIEENCYCELVDDAMEHGGCQHLAQSWALRVPSQWPSGGGGLYEGGKLHEGRFAAHIASWHPGVALTVAELLEVVARDVGTSSLAHHAAQAMARAYLGLA